jgi:hypothetical protein
MGLDTKTYWLTDRQSQCDFDFDFEVTVYNIWFEHCYIYILISDMLFTIIGTKYVVNRNVIDFMQRCSSRFHHQLNFALFSRQLNIYTCRPLQKHDIQLSDPTYARCVYHSPLYMALFAFTCSLTFNALPSSCANTSLLALTNPPTFSYYLHC